MIGKARRGLSVGPFEPRHVAEAAAIASAHMARFRREVPQPPERWTRPDVLAERFADITGRAPAAAALVNGRLVGMLAATRAYTRADRRGGGVATSLLNAGLAWAGERGYARCAVDYESANLLASRFWSRHFAIVEATLRRRI